MHKFHELKKIVAADYTENDYIKIYDGINTAVYKIKLADLVGVPQLTPPVLTHVYASSFGGVSVSVDGPQDFMAYMFTIEVATDEAFTNIVSTATSDSLGSTSAGGLQLNTLYYIRAYSLAYGHKRSDYTEVVSITTPEFNFNNKVITL